MNHQKCTPPAIWVQFVAKQAHNVFTNCISWIHPHKYNYTAIYTDCPLSSNQNKVIMGVKCKAGQAGVSLDASLRPPESSANVNNDKQQQSPLRKWDHPLCGEDSLPRAHTTGPRQSHTQRCPSPLPPPWHAVREQLPKFNSRVIGLHTYSVLEQLTVLFLFKKKKNKFWMINIVNIRLGH